MRIKYSPEARDKLCQMKKEEGIKRVSLIMKGIRNLSDYPRQFLLLKGCLEFPVPIISYILSILIYFTGLRITQFILQLCTVNVKISCKKCSGFHFAHLKVLNSGANKIIFPYHFLLTIYRFFLIPLSTHPHTLS